MEEVSNGTTLRSDAREFDSDAQKAIIDRYKQPSFKRATWQVINTFGSYIALWILMYFSLKVSWWLTVPLAILAGGILIRVFIIFHDCGHGSFYASRKANNFFGFWGGLFTFTPFDFWRWQHSTHHATSGDLDRRGTGDMWTMTVQEYLESSRWKRLGYLLARNPIILFVIAPLYLFLVHQRFSSSKAIDKATRSVTKMNLALLAMVVGMSLIFGFWTYVILQLIVLGLAGSGGIWLFYVQHQFEDVYWARSEDWDATKAALQGSSYYKLPRVLQWFSGNIGFHHIHHLSPRIPNYNLESCHNADPVFQDVTSITLLTSLKSLFYRLWDESNFKLISFRQARKLYRQPQRALKD